MSKFIRLFAALLVMAMIASACGGDEEGDDAATAETTTTTTAATTTTEAETTTTESTTTTTEAPDLGPLNPLNGVPIGDDDPADHAAVVVKISNNDGAARSALIGLDRADLVYEERIEVEATRFAAVFHSDLPEEVGSVRSGRTTDVDIVSNLNRPVFAYWGSNDGVASQLRQAENEGLLVRADAATGGSEFRRVNTSSAPNNGVADVAALVERAEDGEPPAPVFDFSNNIVDLGAPSAGVRIAARQDALFVWDEDLGGYERFHDLGQDSFRLQTREEVVIAPANVVVLTTTYLPSQIDSSSVDAVTVGSGAAVVYSNGFRVEGEWAREFPRDPYTLTTPDGDVIGLGPGQIWVSLTPAGTAAEISQREADALRGN